MENNSDAVRKANNLALAGMILGIIIAAYGAIMYLFVWALMISGQAKAIVAVAIGTSTGGLIVSSALLIIVVVYMSFVK